MYYRAAVNKTAWHWHQSTHEDQCNRIPVPEINPHILSQLTFDKETETHPGGKHTFFKLQC